jgi:TolA-binding protein
MKKLIIAYLCVLLTIFFIFSALDRKGDCVIEKKIWKLYQQQVEISKDPIAVPEKVYRDLIVKYQEVINQYPQSHLIPKLYINLGEIYILKKDYVMARQIFQRIIEQYPQNKNLVAETSFHIGKTYEMAQNWTEAKNIYGSLLKDYPLTDVGLNMPLYIINYHKVRDDDVQLRGAYQFAVNHYANIASDYDNTGIGMTALRHLSNCYLDQGRWNEAIGVLGNIIEKYAATEHLTIKNTDMIIKAINMVAAYRLKDYDVAIQLYQGIIQRNPQHPLKGYLTKVIDAFNQLKAKGIQVSDQQ